MPDNKEPQPITDPGAAEVQSRTTTQASSQLQMPTENQKPAADALGYVKLNDTIVANIKAVKEYEERGLRYLDGLAQIAGVDPRWLARGRTALQDSAMFTIRALAQPQRIRLPEDNNG